MPQAPGAPGPGYPWSTPSAIGATEVLQGGPVPAVAPRRGRVAALVVGLLALVLVVGAGGVYLVRNVGSRVSAGRDQGPGGSGLPRSSGRSDPFGVNPPLTTPSPTFTKPASGWTVPVNAYCREVDLQLKGVPKARTAVELAARLRQESSILTAMNSKLRGMTVPQQNKPDFDAMLAAWDQLPAGYEQAAAAVLKGDGQTAQDLLDRVDSANQKGNDLANRMGLTDCADAGGLPGATPQPSSSVI